MEAAPPPAHLIAAGAIWPPICAVMVGLRFYARRYLNRRLLWDDWLNIPALLLTWGLGAAMVAGTALKSLGYPTPPPLPGENTKTNTAFQLLWAFELMQLPMLGLVKLSFVMFYRRIFCHANGSKAMNVATWAVAALTVLWAVGITLGILFVCGTDFSAWWRSVADNNKYCPGTLKYQNGMAISDLLLDLFVFILPIPSVCKLHMSMKRKLATIGVFGVGLITIAASMTRMVIFIKAVRVDFTAHQDNDLLITGAIYWSMNEAGFALVAANLPALYGLFRTGLSRKPGSYPDSRSRWRYGSHSASRKQRTNSNTSEIHMTEYSADSTISHSHAQWANQDRISDPEGDQIRVINDVYITNTGNGNEVVRGQSSWLR